ncbi:MAG: molybdenum cofactor biosynthesis protein MoaE [Rhodospirillales bacterium]|nr:molybdenum cofactor biosynthesis protein MoaE [Rhodospirillales bacterium]
MAIRVQSEGIDVSGELAAFADATAAGATCLFVGRVRDVNAGVAVAAMTLEYYPGMAEKELARIESAARGQWPLQDVLVIHRYGRLQPGDEIVLVAVASAHRDAAFDACRFLVDWLKTRAPFWKSEAGPAGSRWVGARAEDDAAAERWEKGEPLPLDPGAPQ